MSAMLLDWEKETISYLIGRRKQSDVGYLTWKNLSEITKPSPKNYPSSTNKKVTCLNSQTKVLNETRVKLTLLIMKPYKNSLHASANCGAAQGVNVQLLYQGGTDGRNKTRSQGSALHILSIFQFFPPFSP